jgi:DNA-binding PadR family transcriptional regulator
MHPYELQSHMRERGHDQVIKLKGGSLYHTIERLQQAGLIEPIETGREGRRPERTVYAITPQGIDELLDWFAELLARPQPEFPMFGAAVAFLAALPPEQVVQLFEHRAAVLEAELAREASMMESMRRSNLPRIFSVETEYQQAMLQAELRWVQDIVADIRSGALTWPDDVLALHKQRQQERDQHAQERES